jgi:hypothetical protein
MDDCDCEGCAHIIPEDDTREHTACVACWCEPLEIEDMIWLHKSADGREAYENGSRKPS